MTTMTISAPAKLNLSLAVSSEIHDGKHLLESVFTTIDLVDQLEFEYDQDAPASLRIYMDFSPDIPRIRIAQPKNIVYQALRAFEQRFKCVLRGSLFIRIRKNIPAQAGLGGGSGNAAAALTAIQELSGVRPDRGELLKLAAELGSDVPFFLDGGCALMGGRGETLLQRLELPELDIVLVKPQQGLSTALVYQEFDRAPVAPDDLSEMVRLLQAPSLLGAVNEVVAPTPAQVAALLTNNLSLAAESLVPEITGILHKLNNQPGVHKAMLTGSGSTVFAITESRQAAEDAANHFKALGFWTHACKTLPGGSVDLL